MDTKADESVQGTVKNSSTSIAMEVPNGRRKTKSSAVGSSQGDTSIPCQKAQPNYLKPTISSALESRNNLKKQSSKAPVTKRPARATLEKQPPLKQPPQKAPATASSKGKNPLRPESSSLKTATSSKPISEKTTKTVRGVKSQPPTKQWILKRGTVPQNKNNAEEPKAPATATVGETSDFDNQILASDQQDQNELVDSEGSGIVTSESEKEEEFHTEAPPAQDQTVGHLKVPEQIHESLETSDEPKEEPAINEVGDINEVIIDEEKEKEQIDEKHEADDALLLESKESPATVNTDKEERAQEEDKEETMVHEKILSPLESSEEIADNSNFEKGTENGGNGGGDENSGNEIGPSEESDSKPRPENMPMKKQGVKGRKEAPAYNDVIEETASKLSEKRKNRVLALAGAFETVISLHESEAQVTKD